MHMFYRIKVIIEPNVHILTYDNEMHVETTSSIIDFPCTSFKWNAFWDKFVSRNVLVLIDSTCKVESIEITEFQFFYGHYDNTYLKNGFKRIQAKVFMPHIESRLGLFLLKLQK